MNAREKSKPAAAKTLPRICLVIGFYLPDYSGASLQAHRLLKHLSRRGLSAMVVTIQRPGLARFERIDGIPVYRVPAGASKWTPAGVLRFWWRLLVLLVRLRRKFDVIHVVGAHLQLSAAGPIARLLRKPAIVKVTLARSDLLGLGKGRWGMLQEKCLQCFDRYISISPEISAELRVSPLEGRKIVEIPNGVDLDCFHPFESEVIKLSARERFGLDGEPVAVYVGVLNHRKGIDVLVEAWLRAKMQGCPGKLMLVGPEDDSDAGDFADTIKQRIRNSPAGDSIVFRGPVPDLAPLLRACDVFVLASRAEGLPNVVLEAMASALPVVVSDGSGAQELLRGGIGGWNFPGDASQTLANMLRELMTDSTLRRNLGRAGRRRIAAEFSLDRIARRYLDLYHSLLRMPREGRKR